MTEEKNEIIDAFSCYDWIISYTNPITKDLYLGNINVPPYIKEQVGELRETEFTKKEVEEAEDLRTQGKLVNPWRNSFLSSASINLLLRRLVEKLGRNNIPLYKVASGKEISSLADIKCLWDEMELNSSTLEWEEYF